MNWGMKWPDKKFQVILSDPPWSFETYSDKGQGRSPEYPTMTRRDIANLPVGSLAAEACVLFLWVTPQDFEFAITEVMPAWGFKYKTTGFVWAKLKSQKSVWKGIRNFFKQLSVHMENDPDEFVSSLFTQGKGYYTRKQTELCLIGTTKKIPPRKSRGVGELITKPRREHSRKPDQQYEKIEALFDGPYLEMFARQQWSDKWDVWGLETDMFTPEIS